MPNNNFAWIFASLIERTMRLTDNLIEAHILRTFKTILRISKHFANLFLGGNIIHVGEFVRGETEFQLNREKENKNSIFPYRS